MFLKLFSSCFCFVLLLDTFTYCRDNNWSMTLIETLKKFVCSFFSSFFYNRLSSKFRMWCILILNRFGATVDSNTTFNIFFFNVYIRISI